MTSSVVHLTNRAARPFWLLSLIAACSDRPLSLEAVQGGGDNGAGIADQIDGNGNGSTTCDSSFGGPAIPSLADLPTPIAEWLFDEGNGACLSDSTGNGNTGRVMKGNTVSASINPGPQWVAGHTGFALRFGGVDDWVSALPTSGMRHAGSSGAISVSAWVNVSHLPKSGKRTTALFRCRMARTLIGGVFVGLSPDGKFSVGSNQSLRGGDEPFPIGQWVHVAMTHDGYRQCGYVAGKQVACQRAGWPPTSIETPFTMGADIDESNIIDHLDGALDEVRVYGQALRPEQVALLAR
jgi:Concanavalin A-like lectin/glucanases superfamily